MKREEFVKRFLDTFAEGIPSEKLREHYIGGGARRCLWNLFAASLVPCYRGKQAMELYDEAEKDGAVEIEYRNGGRNPKETVDLKENHLTAEGVEEECWKELYIIGKNFSWCFVATHEDGFADDSGPYFCFKP